MEKPSRNKTPASAANKRVGQHDRRRHLRANLPLKASFLNDHGVEQACLVVNISAGGALVRTKNPPPFGKTVVLYVDQLGRFEGRVIRSGSASFAVSYEKRRERTARTADDLTELVNKGRRSRDRRSGPRIRQNAPAVVHFEDGRTEQCAILDISLTGASIEISPRPPLGTHLILGRMTAKVVRRHEKGVGVVFTGGAKRMDDVVAGASAVGVDAPPPSGAAVARAFGKKAPGA